MDLIATCSSVLSPPDDEEAPGWADDDGPAYVNGGLATELTLGLRTSVLASEKAVSLRGISAPTAARSIS